MRTRAIPRGCDATPVGAAPQQVQLLVTAPAVGDVVLEVMPQRDGELAGKSYDGDAPHASLLGADALAEPTGQRTVGLVAQPHPGASIIVVRARGLPALLIPARPPAGGCATGCRSSRDSCRPGGGW